MEYKKELLIKSAARLYSLGIDLEGAKDRIRKMVADGIGYDAPEMLQAVGEYAELKAQWDSLEQDHIQLREEINKRQEGTQK